MAIVTTVSLNITVNVRCQRASHHRAREQRDGEAGDLPVSGTALAGSQVQLYLNGAVTGGLITVNGSGNFGGSVVLPAEGGYTITADARNSRGTSPQSAAVSITYAIAAPTVAVHEPGGQRDALCRDQRQRVGHRRAGHREDRLLR